MRCPSKVSVATCVLLLQIDLFSAFAPVPIARGGSRLLTKPAKGEEKKIWTCRPAILSIARFLNLERTEDEDDPVASTGTSSANFNSDTFMATGAIVPEASGDATSGSSPPCVIKILGVGGGGGNAVNRMIKTGIGGVTFWAINTDAQALAKSLAPNVINIGQQLTRGLGAGGMPDVGEKAALENIDELRRICEGADMVFITAGMGGGTGSGAATVLADIAKNECDCLTVGVVTKPFAFEGRRRMKQAEKSIAKLRENVDTLIVVSNDKLLQIVPENTPVTDAFLVADDILRQGVVGISEIILKAGLVNVDFADVRSVMKDAGTALMGVGTGEGKTRASDAAVAAISSPLLDFPIQSAKRIVFNIVGPEDMGLREINQASEVIYQNADEDANIIFGALVDPTMEKEISVTVLACDFDGETDRQILPYAAGVKPEITTPEDLQSGDSDQEEVDALIIAEQSKKLTRSEPQDDGIEEDEISVVQPKKRGRFRRMLGKIVGRKSN